MPRDPDNPYGMQFRGRERALRFVHPYRHVGELSPVEQIKLKRHPFEVAQAVIDRYSKEGAESIATVPGETERLKWVGLYPQRQGGDAFMMRIKVPGGVLTAPQVREIGVAADAFAEGPEDSPVFGNRYADLTTRQDIQLHWLRIEDIPRVWQRFWDVGLTTVQACGDSARNVCSCPVSGVDADEVVDALPVAQAISAFFTGNREYANLPRKFKIAVTGCLEDCARVEIDDIGLWPARDAEGSVGFNVLVGGGLSDGERMAQDIDVFVRPDQAVELTRAIAQLFGELGNRENRGLARMRYLAQELGPEGFRSALAERARFGLAPAGQELTRRFRGDHVGVHPQKQPGLVYVGCSVPVGRMHGIELVDAARLAETYGDGTIRIGTDQNFVLSGVPEERLDALLAEPLVQSYSPFPGPFTAGSWRVPAASSAGSPWSRPKSGPSNGHASWTSSSTSCRDRGRRRRRRRTGTAPCRCPWHSRAARPRRPFGAGGGRRGDPDALLGVLGVVRPAPDRRHRVPGGHRARRRAHRRGGRHRSRGLARARRRVHRLGGRRPAGGSRARRAGASGRAVPGRATRRRAVPQLGTAHAERRAPVGAGGGPVKRYRLREDMNGIDEPPGKVWFWELEAGVIDADRCIQCGTCVAVCPSNSIGVNLDTDLPELVKMCTGCSLCWDFCPRGGLRYEALWPPSSVEEGTELPVAEVKSDSSDTYWKITVDRRPKAWARCSRGTPSAPPAGSTTCRTVALCPRC